LISKVDRRKNWKYQCSCLQPIPGYRHRQRAPSEYNFSHNFQISIYCLSIVLFFHINLKNFVCV
jgi:hypothetical protein